MLNNEVFCSVWIFFSTYMDTGPEVIKPDQGIICYANNESDALCFNDASSKPT